MHAHPRRIVVLLSSLVRLMPIAFCIPPQRLQRRAYAGGRLWSRKRISEGLKIQGHHRREIQGSDNTRAGRRAVACIAFGMDSVPVDFPCSASAARA